MKQRRFASSLGAMVIAMTGGWSQTKAVHAIPFTPPRDNVAPRTSTGGASRGSFFTPPPESSVPQSSTSGASRDSFFTPPAENAAPQDSAGGASRDSFFAPPTENAAPQDSAGGASRRLNESADIPIAAAADSMLAVTPESLYGKTLEARPTVLVYVPPSSASGAIFSLKNEARDTIYQMTLAVPKTGGVIAVELPENAPELAIAQNYQWYVALEIDGELTLSSPFVEGWVRRVAPSSELAIALSKEDHISRIAALGANGIWYDTAAQLASLQKDQGDEALSAHWFELLESVGLANIAAVPIVQ
ncbi:MAG: DUF928 domain-containing protein [Cyanobacteria bacterium P01_D01_bin.1]